MEFERYLELQTILQQWKTRLAESIRRRIELDSRLLDRLQELYEADGASEEFTLWLDRWCRQAAIQFILRVLFLRVLEDRGLLGATRIRSTDGQKMWGQLTRNLGAAAYVQWCCWDAAHLLPDLFGPTDYELVLPDDDLAQRFLDEVWRRPDPNRPGWLRFDFRQDPERGDEGFQTRFIGDLYQDLDAEIRERYALLQTPHFISQFILEHTLLKRFEEKDFREVTLIDPTCGSGHFLVDAFWHFVRQYESLALKTLKRKELTPTERIKIARRVIEEHIFGCDVNAYATALTRFRLTLAVCEYAHSTSLRDLRSLRFNIVTIDSLISYEKMLGAGEWIGEKTAQILGSPSSIRTALPLLKRRYDVVVGNPPYITTDDVIKRDLYREHYVSAYRLFGLSAPFTERFINLTCDGGSIGLINSNAFARRQFGVKLIEQVLPKYQLDAIVDLSGVNIPGHGTPTVILFIRNQTPVHDSLKLISCLKGETKDSGSIPGPIWKTIIKYFSEDYYEDSNIAISLQPKRIFEKHPWNFSLSAIRIMEKIKSKDVYLSSLAEEIGSDCAPGLDEIYIETIDHARRIGFQVNHLRLLQVGEEIRDWQNSPHHLIIFPYNSELEVIELEKDEILEKFLTPFKSLLSNRVSWGKTMLERGLRWYEFDRFFPSKHAGLRICYPLIATHPSFNFELNKAVLKNSGMVVKLSSNLLDDYKKISGLLNSSLVTFFLKQVCFNKGMGEDPIRDRYVYDASYVGDIPLPSDKLSSVSSYLYTLSTEAIEISMKINSVDLKSLFRLSEEAYEKWYQFVPGYNPSNQVFKDPFCSANNLRQKFEKLQSLRESLISRLIFIQEEIDWLIYELYGLINKSPLAENYLIPSDYEVSSLTFGQRAFEVAGKGYRGDLPKGYKPAPLPDSLIPLTEARIAIIENNQDIAILEDPLYKRRWIPPDYEKEFHEVAEWWLAEKLEYALEHHGKPISLRQWARLLQDDERVNAVLEVLTGSQAYDLECELLKVIQVNMVPNRPEHYLKPSGLRKYNLWKNQDENIVPPEFKSSDFNDSTAWRIRGKLNIPRERFIAYTEFDHTCKGCDAPESGGPWFGWAGWDPAKRADALAFLLEQANRAGWELHFRQCGLRAALRELLPELEGLLEADQLEFKGLATMCGISLETECYCQSYRAGMVNGEPTVPGVSKEVLSVNVLRGVSNLKRATGKKDLGADQLKFNM